MNDSPINSIIDSTTVGELADATSLRERNYGIMINKLWDVSIAANKLRKRNDNQQCVFSIS